MDGRARLALEDVVRRTVAADLDELATEVANLRREVLTLERLCGLPGTPLPRRERRLRVAEMRANGFSVRSIATELHCDRNTVVGDLKALGVAPPAGQVVGLDGRTTRPRMPSS